MKRLVMKYIGHGLQIRASGGNEFNSFSPDDLETTKSIIEKNDFFNIDDLICSNEIKDFLKRHYLISRDDIKNPDSDIYLEKEEYDNINRKHQDIS